MDLVAIAARIAGTGGTFDLNELKSRIKLSDMWKYASERLENIGTGASRTVFLLDSSRVLKVGMSPLTDTDGTLQNRKEAKLAAVEEISEIVPTVHDHDDGGKWLVCDFASPLSSESEFESLTGFGLYDLLESVKSGKWLDDRLSPGLAAMSRNDVVMDELYSFWQWGEELRRPGCGHRLWIVMRV